MTQSQYYKFSSVSKKVHKCVECSAKDLVCQDDRHLAPVQPYNSFCRGGSTLESKSYLPLKQKVLLQTYIEYLRGLVEDKKKINHHGREVEVDLDLLSEKPSLTQVYDLK